MIYTESKFQTAEAVREEAFEELKIGGDPMKAIALGLVYLGDRVQEVGHHDVEGAIERAASVVEGGLAGLPLES